MIYFPTLHLGELCIQPAALPPCPFCGDAPSWEAHPNDDDILRIACTSDACAVAPRTEYLLSSFAGELRAAWSHRPLPAPPHDAHAAAPRGHCGSGGHGLPSA